LTRELKRLAEAGLLNCERQGNQLLYSANRQSPIFEELAGILRKTSGLADVIADALEPLTEHIEVALIFGSVARGSETRGSDVDVLIIGPWITEASSMRCTRRKSASREKSIQRYLPHASGVRSWRREIPLC